MKENNTYNEELGGKNLPDSLRVNPFAIPNHFFAEQENQILLQIKLDSLRHFNENKESNATGATVPDGYFDTLENNIFAKIAELDLKDKVSESGFAVPDQYFEQFSQNIEGRISEDNLKSFSPALDYQVAEDYFVKAEEGIFAKIAEQDLRNKISEGSGFTVPSEYFAQATTEIEDRILVEKWSTQFGKDHFTVPVGYFNQLSESIHAKTKTETEKVHVITLPKRTSWKKYAAAAVAILVGTGAYFGFQNTNSNSQIQQQMVSSDVNLENISNEEILSYLAQVSEGEDLIRLAEFASDNTEENAQLDSNIENDEIEDYLNYML